MTKPETPSSFSNESKKMSDIPCPMSPRLKKTIEKVRQLASTEKVFTKHGIYVKSDCFPIQYSGPNIYRSI